MATLKIQHAVDAVSGMQALHDVLSEDLSQIEAGIEELASTRSGKKAGSEELDTYLQIRAALHGGIASVNDVLGWVRLMTEKDIHGDEYRTVGSLPNVPVSPMN